MTWIDYDRQLVEAIAARLDLRDPNRRALHAVADKIASGDGAEWICDLATGVGKTYLAAGFLEYLADRGVRDVAIVVPLDAIYEKTIANFTPGAQKYIPGADWEPTIITVENYRTSGEARDDPNRLKLYIFKIQTLLKPNDEIRRRVHGVNEDTGDSLYEYLQNVDDLVVIADEHHVYSGDAEKYGAAIRNLGARAVIGLTATPNQRDVTADKVIFQYSLAEAIADELVKIPVVVYRGDGIKDERSQLADACHLRDVKETAWRAYAHAAGSSTVVPVLFIVCQTVADAERTADTLATHFLPGEGQVLLVTGGSSDKALRALQAVEAPDSPVRAVVSVNKLKEGWDVRNIGVIIGLRALASETLTEQVLGRGLRLPFGRRVGIEAVDTVDIVAHDSYRDLLANKKALLEQVLQERTEAALELTSTPSATSGGSQTSTATNSEGAGIPSQPSLTFVFGGDDQSGDHLTDPSLLLKVQEYDEVIDEHRSAAAATIKYVAPVPDAPRIRFPRLERQAVPSRFSLKLITEQQAKTLGSKYLTDESVYMTRVALDAQRGIDGDVVVGTRFLEEEKAYLETVPVSSVKSQLESRVLALSVVESTVTEYAAAGEVISWFLEGAGVADNGEATWSTKRSTLATRALEAAIIKSYELRATSPTWEFNVIEVPVLPPTRIMPSPIHSRWESFVKGLWYGDWVHSIEPVASFDAKSTEWALANILESSSQIKWWLRIYTNGPIWIEYDGGKYFADFIAVDSNGDHWLIEGKADDDASDPDVVMKRRAAEAWVEKVNSAGVYGDWHYLFATETVIANAKGRWLDLTKEARAQPALPT
ncbi:DEAD/DEAH box helicase [Nocardia pseudovaccinii]|uniref:DEAD/DEAH box helicase n=1 Tax=Nocardia pseudovaccinii TaxID=189540 RepID=UPI0007A4FA83|nr:DEAD/DEAH box helicase family protein [Nocardia pseudovaccinii]